MEVDLATFTEIDAAGWEQIAKDPAGTAGNRVIVFAEVTQFDSATGTDTFRANVGAEQPAAEFELETNAILFGDAQLLTGFSTGDVVKAHVVVEGPIEYETVMGGATTAPSLQVVAVENVGFKDLSADVVLGEPSHDEWGGMSIPVTVTNSSSEQMTYSISLAAESPDGSTQHGTTSAYAENLAPGQSATVDADFYDDIPKDAVFKVAAVERYNF